MTRLPLPDSARYPPGHVCNTSLPAITALSTRERGTLVRGGCGGSRSRAKLVIRDTVPSGLRGFRPTKQLPFPLNFPAQATNSFSPLSSSLETGGDPGLLTSMHRQSDNSSPWLRSRKSDLTCPSRISSFNCFLLPSPDLVPVVVRLPQSGGHPEQVWQICVHLVLKLLGSLVEADSAAVRDPLPGFFRLPSLLLAVRVGVESDLQAERVVDLVACLPVPQPKARYLLVGAEVVEAALV